MLAAAPKEDWKHGLRGERELDAGFYRNYKRMVFMGLGALLVFTTLALASYNLSLGIFGFLLTLGGMFGLGYMDKMVEEASRREFQEQLLAATGAGGEPRPPQKAALISLEVDGYEEALRAVRPEQRPLLTTRIDSFLREWAGRRGACLCKGERGRYFCLVREETLAELESEGFGLLQEIQHVTAEAGSPVTLSIGVGKDGEDLASLGRLAEDALRIARARGGNQAVVKNKEHTWFYGGSGIPSRSRLLSPPYLAPRLAELLRRFPQVVIVGPKEADLDALGAALALAELALSCSCQPRLVLDVSAGPAATLAELISGSFPGLLGEGKEVAAASGPHSLVLLVAVSSLESVSFPPLLSRAGGLGLITHCPGDEERAAKASFLCVDPGASSTSELVAELARFFPGEFSFSGLAASALFAGIVSKACSPGAAAARALRAAARLWEAGADPALAASFSRVELPVFLSEVKMLRSVELVADKYALAGCEEELPRAALAAAGAADVLLGIAGVEAAFVLYSLPGGTGVRARSAGAADVGQLLRELGGEGAPREARAYLQGVPFSEGKRRLVSLLSGMAAKGGESREDEGNPAAGR